MVSDGTHRWRRSRVQHAGGHPAPMRARTMSRNAASAAEHKRPAGRTNCVSTRPSRGGKACSAPPALATPAEQRPRQHRHPEPGRNAAHHRLEGAELHHPRSPHALPRQPLLQQLPVRAAAPEHDDAQCGRADRLRAERSWSAGAESRANSSSSTVSATRPGRNGSAHEGAVDLAGEGLGDKFAGGPGPQREVDLGVRLDEVGDRLRQPQRRRRLERAQQQAPAGPAVVGTARAASASRRSSASANGSSRSPAGVSRTPRAARSNSVPPRSASSRLMCAETLDCTVLSCAAALPMPPSRATTPNMRRSATFIRDSCPSSRRSAASAAQSSSRRTCRARPSRARRRTPRQRHPAEQPADADPHHPQRAEFSQAQRLLVTHQHVHRASPRLHHGPHSVEIGQPQRIHDIRPRALERLQPGDNLAEIALPVQEFLRPRRQRELVRQVRAAATAASTRATACSRL